VATALFASTEYRQDLVRGIYPTYLSRPADPAGLDAWVSALANGTRDEIVLNNILGSLEYFRRL
jgi:hypothetical protein